MNRYTVLAFDFGASSGRGILATLEDGALSYREIHRFENNPMTQEEGGITTLFWDLEYLFDHIKQGIEKAGVFDSISFDAWGVDFGLLDADGKLLQNPVHYRDQRTKGMADYVRTLISDETLYQRTGNNILELNTLFQLVALQQQNPQLLERAETLLFVPDLFAYLLSGVKNCERTIASTSQMLDPVTGQFAMDVLQQLNIKTSLLLPTTASGSVIGHYKGSKVISGAGHDTQSAIIAMPSNEEEVAFLSCGTWSILGTEVKEPILSAESLACGLSNELGANGKMNYMKNINGLWLIQESRRAWRRQGQEYSYAELEQQAREAQPFQCFIDVDDPAFASFGDLPGRIASFCERTGQVVPQTVGAIMRCIYESLALKYKEAFDLLGQMSGKSFTALHLLGGGTKDGLLCQMTANSLQKTVIAGPVEATALGNIIMQLIALGGLKDVQEGRQLLQRTESLSTYYPCDAEQWKAAFVRYQQIS